MESVLPEDLLYAAPYFIHKHPVAVEFQDLLGIFFFFRAKSYFSIQVHQLISLRGIKITPETISRKTKQVDCNKSP